MWIFNLLQRTIFHTTNIRRKPYNDYNEELITIRKKVVIN